MIYLFISVVIFILLILFWYFGKKPAIHKNISQEDLKKYFEVLLYRGYDRGYMIIQVSMDKRFKRFLQVSKYIGDKNKLGLQFDYPLANWSKPYYEKFKSILNKNRIKFEIEKTDQDKIPEFLVIDVEKDLDKAYKISKLALQELYSLSPDDLIKLYFINVSEEDEKIGF